MDKKELRDFYKSKRKVLVNREDLSKKIIRRLLNQFDFDDKVVSVFIPIEKFNEIDTWPLFEPVHGNDTFYCVPRIDSKDKIMHHFLYESKNQLIQNDWGIWEPKSGSPYSEDEFDVVLVPLLAYDLKGHRIGYGGGYYDRFLSKCKKDVVKIGLSYFPPEKEKFETENTDIPLNFCVTPDKIYEFK